jgi:hypothetical protein
MPVRDERRQRLAREDRRGLDHVLVARAVDQGELEVAGAQPPELLGAPEVDDPRAQRVLALVQEPQERLQSLQRQVRHAPDLNVHAAKYPMSWVFPLGLRW